MLIDLIVGTRPNFMKVAPIIRAIKNRQLLEKTISYRLIHTGQHYDFNMSESFFQQLGIPLPEINFDISIGSITQQTANIMIEYEKLLNQKISDLCMVVGDVTSTMACAITAKRFNIKIAHVEGGLRSGDPSMPEEINRILTDSISDIFFTTSEHANENLLENGVLQENIQFVGNTMIDSLMQNIARIQKPHLWDHYDLKENHYFLLTLHRPKNVDNTSTLSNILNELISSCRDFPILFPVHPRTKNSLAKLNLPSSNLIMVEPQTYLEFLFLIKHTKAIITDSGGITEEATFLDVPCITLRETTERPETVLLGTNKLVGSNYAKLSQCLTKVFDEKWKVGTIPEKWDGKTSDRIIDYLIKSL